MQLWYEPEDSSLARPSASLFHTQAGTCAHTHTLTNCHLHRLRTSKDVLQLGRKRKTKLTSIFWLELLCVRGKEGLVVLRWQIHVIVRERFFTRHPCVPGEEWKTRHENDKWWQYSCTTRLDVRHGEVMTEIKRAYLLYSAPRNRLRGFLHTLHSENRQMPPTSSEGLRTELSACVSSQPMTANIQVKVMCVCCKLDKLSKKKQKKHLSLFNINLNNSNYSTPDTFLCWPLMCNSTHVSSAVSLDMRWQGGGTGTLLQTCVWLPETLGRCSTSPLAEEKRLAELLVSTPPRRGRKWLTDTCSIKDVPYFLKYHHSKIWTRG